MNRRQLLAGLIGTGGLFALSEKTDARKALDNISKETTSLPVRAQLLSYHDSDGASFLLYQQHIEDPTFMIQDKTYRNYRFSAYAFPPNEREPLHFGLSDYVSDEEFTQEFITNEAAKTFELFVNACYAGDFVQHDVSNYYLYASLLDNDDTVWYN